MLVLKYYNCLVASIFFGGLTIINFDRVSTFFIMFLFSKGIIHKPSEIFPLIVLISIGVPNSDSSFLKTIFLDVDIVDGTKITGITAA